MSDTRFKAVYPDKSDATVYIQVRFGVDSLAKGPVIEIPAFYLRPGQSLKLTLLDDGRIAVEDVTPVEKLNA